MAALLVALLVDYLDVLMADTWAVLLVYKLAVYLAVLLVVMMVVTMVDTMVVL